MMYSLKTLSVKATQSALSTILRRPVTIHHRGEPQMALYVVSTCQLSCHECSAAPLMKKDAGYHMSLEEVRALIHHSELSNYTFHYRLTGGEPLLWKNLIEGVRLLRQSPSCLSISIITNGINESAATEELMELIDCLRISNYLYNNKQIDSLERKYPHKILVMDKQEFMRNPTEKVASALPVDCDSRELMYYNGDVYPCCLANQVAARFSVEIKASEKLRVNFADAMGQIRDDIAEELCTRCTGNKGVKKTLEKLVNVSGTSANPEKLKKMLKTRRLKFIPSHCLPKVMRHW